MKPIRIYLLVVTLVVLFSLEVTSASAGPSLAAAGTAFTYQGELLYQGALANGSFDFQFSLHDASGGGAQVGSTLTKSGVTVTEGRFTVSLDFGGVFTGDARWLEIAVQTAGGSGYTTLSPRQELTPTPYAIHASSVGPIAGDLTVNGNTNLGNDAGDIISIIGSLLVDGLNIETFLAALDARTTALEGAASPIISGYKSGACIGIATDVTPVTCTVNMGVATSTVVASPVGANTSPLVGFIDLYFTGDSTIDYVFYGDADGSISIAVNWIAVPL